MSNGQSRTHIPGSGCRRPRSDPPSAHRAAASPREAGLRMLRVEPLAGRPTPHAMRARIGEELASCRDAGLRSLSICHGRGAR